MFEIADIIEYLAAALICAVLFALCAHTMLGALQQANYGGKKFAVWVRRKGNMTRSRYTLLAFLILLSMAVIGVCFSFAGKWAAYVSLFPVPLFCILYRFANRHALKVELVKTARVRRIFALDILVLFVLSLALIVGGRAVSHYLLEDYAIAAQLRFILLAAVPLCLPACLRLANALETPFSSSKNKKYIAAARKKLASAGCIKIGITGSCGKTSVKNFLAGILSEKYRVFATPASYNTPLGIAKAIEDVDLNGYDVFIAEMGARYRGDIAALCDLVVPDHCIVTGICPQHLESLGSVEGIVAAKGEILRGTKSGGFAVIGQDEFTAKLDPAAAGLVKVTVGAHGEYGAFDVHCSPEGIDFKLALGILQEPVHAALLGAHNAENIALAAALADKLGVERERILSGIAALQPVPHRLQLSVAGGINILDDAYNANVRGAAAALEVLRTFGGRRFVVTPGLVELGVLEGEENAALGGKMAGLDRVILVGETLVTAVKQGYLAAGGDAAALSVVPTLQKAQDILAEELQPGDTVLFLNDLPDIYN